MRGRENRQREREQETKSCVQRVKRKHEIEREHERERERFKGQKKKQEQDPQRSLSAGGETTISKQRDSIGCSKTSSLGHADLGDREASSFERITELPICIWVQSRAVVE